MKSKFICSLFIASGILFFSTSLYASGVGAYVTGSKGTYDWTYHISDYPDYKDSTDAVKMSVGFIYDTNLAYDRLFNYRLQIGYSIFKAESDDFYDITGRDYHLYNSFGFGIFRSGIARIWLGPQIGLGILNGEFDVPSGIYTGENKITTFFLGIGLIAGVNFNIGDFLTLGLDGGYRLNRHWGVVSISDDSWGVTCNGKEGFIEFSVLFRINDTF